MQRATGRVSTANAGQHAKWWRSAAARASLAKSAPAASARSSAAPSACAPCRSSSAMRLASARSPSELMSPRMAWSSPARALRTFQLCALAHMHLCSAAGSVLIGHVWCLHAQRASLMYSICASRSACTSRACQPRGQECTRKVRKGAGTSSARNSTSRPSRPARPACGWRSQTRSARTCRARPGGRWSRPSPGRCGGSAPWPAGRSARAARGVGAPRRTPSAWPATGGLVRSICAGNLDRHQPQVTGGRWAVTLPCRARGPGVATRTHTCTAVAAMCNPACLCGARGSKPAGSSRSRR